MATSGLWQRWGCGPEPAGWELGATLSRLLGAAAVVPWTCCLRPAGQPHRSGAPSKAPLPGSRPSRLPPPPPPTPPSPSPLLQQVQEGINSVEGCEGVLYQVCTGGSSSRARLPPFRQPMGGGGIMPHLCMQRSKPGLLQVRETLPPEILEKIKAPPKADDPIIQPEELPDFDGLIFGGKGGWWGGEGRGQGRRKGGR